MPGRGTGHSVRVSPAPLGPGRGFVVPMGADAGPLAGANAALDGGEWAVARDAYAALVDTQGAAAHEGVATAAWWLDDGRLCLDAHERAYRACRESGDTVGAARAATALGYDAALFGQGASVAQGWLGRARELLATLRPETTEHGWFAVREAEFALQVTHQLDVAKKAAAAAIQVGRTIGAGDLQVVGQALAGLADVLAGHIDEGMAQLDTAVVSALSGEVRDPMWVGKVCCWLVAACRDAQDLPRAVEWCARVEDLCRDRDLAPLLTTCRIQYASVRLASGHWIEAEQELVAALDRMRGSRRTTRVDGVVQLGHLRRRQGRLDEADELYAQAGYAPQAVVGRALVLLARGDAATAWATVSDVLQDVPRDDRLARAQVLLPAVRCSVAARAREPALEAARELAEIADELGTAAARGASAVAAALLGSDAGAPAAWRIAVRCLNRAGLRVDEAEARIGLARSLPADETVVKVAELGQAVSLLESLEAPSLLAEARSLLEAASGAPDRSSPLTPREREVLRLVASGRSNTQIAAELVVSEHTVHRHVANILTRLGEPTRAAAVAHAARDGLL